MNAMNSFYFRDVAPPSDSGQNAPGQNIPGLVDQVSNKSILTGLVVAGVIYFAFHKLSRNKKR